MTALTSPSPSAAQSRVFGVGVRGVDDLAPIVGSLHAGSTRQRRTASANSPCFGPCRTRLTAARRAHHPGDITKHNCVYRVADQHLMSLRPSLGLLDWPVQEHSARTAESGLNGLP